MNVLDECWEWRGRRTRDGYGIKTVAGKQVRLHRWAYEWANGPIPPGMFVLHRCDNPPCCNPGHLRVGTNEENIRESVEKGRHINASKPACPRGHEYSGHNLLLVRARDGFRRRCRECERQRQAKVRLRKKQMV